MAGAALRTCLSSHSAPACVEVCHGRTNARDTFVLRVPYETSLACPAPVLGARLHWAPQRMQQQLYMSLTLSKGAVAQHSIGRACC